MIEAGNWPNFIRIILNNRSPSERGVGVKLVFTLCLLGILLTFSQLILEDLNEAKK